MAANHERPRAIIIGAGFGGLWAVNELKDAPVDVWLIDRNNYHSFWPLLYQVASAELHPTQIAHPVRAILHKQRNGRFIMGNVTDVNVDTQAIILAGKKQPPLSYDYLILALGSVSSYFGIPGAEEFTFPLKTMAEGVALRNQILSCFEEASRERDPERRRRLLTFVIVGGGPTGMEYAGALSELVHGPLDKDYPEINVEDDVQIILVEAMDSLLGGMPDKLGRYARRRLEQMQVNVRLEAMVSEVTADCVALKDNSTIATHTVVWTAGVAGHNLPSAIGLPTRRNGTVPVEPTLQAPGHANVYVVGDLAYFEDEDGNPLPMLAPVAIQQGEHAAKNIKRQLNGKTLQPFHYKDKGTMATIGRNAAVANIYGYAFTGFLAWLIWIVIHIAELIGFRNRISVLINWAYNYFFFDRVERFIMSERDN